MDYEKLYEIMYNSVKVSDLPIKDFCQIIRGVIREEIERVILNDKVPEYKGWWETKNENTDNS